MYGKALIAWIVFGLTAFAVGTLRELVLVPRIGEPAAHILGTVTVAAVIALIGWQFTVRIRPGRAEALLLGLFWVALTLLFEFGFFHFVRGIAWERLAADYDIRAGRIWILVLSTELLTPIVVTALARKAARPVGRPSDRR